MGLIPPHTNYYINSFIMALIHLYLLHHLSITQNTNPKKSQKCGLIVFTENQKNYEGISLVYLKPPYFLVSAHTDSPESRLQTSVTFARPKGPVC